MLVGTCGGSVAPCRMSGTEIAFQNGLPVRRYMYHGSTGSTAPTAKPQNSIRYGPEKNSSGLMSPQITLATKKISGLRAVLQRP